MTEQRESRALTALILGAVGIGWAPIFVRFAGADGVGPSAAAFWRLTLSIPIAWLWAARDPRVGSWKERLQLCLPGLFFAGDLAIWHWSIHWTSVANATLLANFQPVLVTLGGWLIFGRRFKRLFLVGMVLALVGAVLLVGASSGGQLKGDLLGLLTAVFYASYFLSVGWLRERFPTSTILAYTVTAAAIILAPIALASGEPLAGYSLAGWLDVIGLAVVSQIIGQGLVIYALAHLPAHFSAVTLLLQPAIAALLAWWFFKEKPEMQQAVGGVVMLAGIVMARRGSR